MRIFHENGSNSQEEGGFAYPYFGHGRRMMIVIAPNSRTRKRGKERGVVKGKYEGI